MNSFAGPNAQPGVPRALRLAELLSVGDQTDQSGRLLLEDSASKRARRLAEGRGVSMIATTCPYRDTPSRYGGQMNSSAYEALRADTAGILDGFAWMTGGQLAANPAAAGTVQLLYDTSYLGVTAPLLLFHRAIDPVPEQGGLPTVVASIFKASRGLFSVSVALLNETGRPSQPVSAAEVVEFADRHRHLVRPDPPRVCAAPTRLIEHTISVILGGEGGTASASAFVDLVPFPMLWRFYRVQDELSQALSMYRFVLDQLSRSHGRVPPVQLFGQMVPGTTGTFGQLTEAMLAHANSAQVDLNRILGRDDHRPALSVPELLQLL